MTLADKNAFIAFGAGIVILFYPVRYLIKKARKYMHEIYALSKHSNEEIQRIVDNMFLIKLLKKEEEELGKFSTTLEKQNDSSYKNIKWTSINGYLPSFSTMLILSILIGIGDLAKSLTLDFIGVTLKLFQVLGTVSDSVNKIVNSHVHLSKLTEVVKNRNIVKSDNFIMNIENENLAVKFENVDFKYFNSDVYIFENLSFEINKKSIQYLQELMGLEKVHFSGYWLEYFTQRQGR